MGIRCAMLITCNKEHIFCTVTEQLSYNNYITVVLVVQWLLRLFQTCGDGAMRNTNDFLPKYVINKTFATNMSCRNLLVLVSLTITAALRFPPLEHCMLKLISLHYLVMFAVNYPCVIQRTCLWMTQGYLTANTLYQLQTIQTLPTQIYGGLLQSMVI